MWLPLFLLDDLLDAPFSGILLFVDFQDLLNIWFIKTFLWTPKFLWRPRHLVFHPVTPDAIYRLDANLRLCCNDFRADVIGFFSDYVLNLSRSQLQNFVCSPLLIPPASD